MLLVVTPKKVPLRSIIGRRRPRSTGVFGWKPPFRRLLSQDRAATPYRTVCTASWESCLEDTEILDLDAPSCLGFSVWIGTIQLVTIGASMGRSAVIAGTYLSASKRCRSWVRDSLILRLLILRCTNGLAISRSYLTTLVKRSTPW